MKILLTFAACLLPLVGFSQGGPIIRNPVTTNNFMNQPQDGWIAIWNNVAFKWSNGVNVASSTNLPGYLQTATLTNLAGTGLNSAATNSSAVLPNLIGTGVTPAATNASSYVASNQGRGTNITTVGLTNVGTITQTGGGTAAALSGAIKFTSLGGNIADADGIARVFVQPLSSGGVVQLYGTNATDGLTIDSNGNLSESKSATIRGVTTNKSGVYVDSDLSGGHGELYIRNTNNLFWTQLVMEDYGAGNINLFMNNYNGTVAAPTAMVAADNVGNWYMTGRGSTQQKTAFSIRSYALNNFTDADSRGMANFNVGENSASTEGHTSVSLTAFNKTNFVDVYNNSNVFYPLLTASRALVLDSNKKVAAATGTPDGTKFLRDDNTYAVPAGAGGTTIQASTNSFDTNSNVVFGKGLLNERNVFWDDFDGPDMKSVAFLQRRSPSGHTYRLTQGSGGIGTNGFLMTGGKWTQTNIVADATYLGVTNNTDKIWNRIGGVFRFKTNEPVAAPYSVEGILTSRIQDFATAAGDFLHSYVLVDSDTIVQRSLAESIIHTGSEDAGLYTRDRVYFEISFFTNCVVTEVNGVFRTAYTNDMTFAYLKCPIWEINGSATNKIHVEWESIWAGYADPALEQAVMENATDQAFNLIGATNAVLSLYSKRKFYQSTNANNIVNFSIPAPPSGYEVVLIHTNSAATNYTVTLFTNGVAASFYSVVDKTNATSWTVPTGAIVAQKFIFTGSAWIRTDVEEPLLTLAAGSGATFTTNGTTLTIAAVAGAAGSTTQVQFNEAGALAGTNEFRWIRGSASVAGTLAISNGFPASGTVHLNGGGLVRRDNGAPGLALGANSVTNWTVDPAGHFLPQAVGEDIGTTSIPVRTLYVGNIVIAGGLAGSRYTNYPTGGLTIDCSTAVTANITNAVASSYSVLLTNAVIGTSGSLGLVSDGTARTITIAAGPAITWMSTNDAPAGAIITTVSKRSLFCWRIGMGTDGLSTNIHCWVKNQTP